MPQTTSTTTTEQADAGAGAGHGDAASAVGVRPSEPMPAAMGASHEALVQAGIMRAGEGLQPSVTGKRVRFVGDQRMVVDGPVAEVKELDAGVWLWAVPSMAEAVAWVKRWPTPMGGESEMERRPQPPADDFGAAFTPALRAQDARRRVQIAEKQQS